MKKIGKLISNEKEILITNENIELIEKIHLLRKHDEIFAGRHVLFDFFSEEYSSNLEKTKELLRESIKFAGATIISENFYSFYPGGFTGIFLLSESHFSIHTWSEIGLITLDSYMCGICNPLVSVKYIIEKINPKNWKVLLFKRGLVNKKLLRSNLRMKIAK